MLKPQKLGKDFLSSLDLKIIEDAKSFFDNPIFWIQLNIIFPYLKL